MLVVRTPISIMFGPPKMQDDEHLNVDGNDMDDIIPKSVQE